MGVRVGWESLLVLLLVLCSLTTTTTATTALVTVIASNDYLESLEMLSNSLRINWPASHSLSKFCVCVALSDIMEDKVRKLGFTVLSFPRHFLYTHHKLRHVLTKNEMRGKYKFTWDKIFAFSVAPQFNRVILMDADMTAQQPLDHLLSLPVDNKIWVVEGRNGWNSGLIVFEPGKELGEHLVGELMKDPSGYLRAGIELSGGGGWLKGEQLFLNGYFGKYREVNYLEKEYNCVFNKKEDCKIFHYAGKRRHRWRRNYVGQ